MRATLAARMKVAAAALAALALCSFAAGAAARPTRSPAAPSSRPTTRGTSASTRCRSRANSDAIIATIGAGTGLHPDFGSGTWDGGPIGIPYNVVTRRQKKVARRGSTTPTRATPARTRSRRSATIECGGDRHVAACVDLERVQALRAVRAQAQRAAAGRPARARSGACGSNALRPAGWTSADAAGLPILPGLARYDEVARRRDRPRAAVHGRSARGAPTSTRRATTRAR